MQWSETWNMTQFVITIQSEIDFAFKSKITNFYVKYQIPEASIKIAFFNWDNSRQQGHKANFNGEFSAMIISNISMKVEHFKSQDTPKREKPYVVGLMFESFIIEQKIQQIQQLFYYNFLVLFLMPLLLIVCALLTGEILFILSFSRKIFSTINDLYDKIHMLNKQQREKMNQDKNRLTNNHNTQHDEYIKSGETEGDVYFDYLSQRRLGQGSNREGSIQGKEQNVLNSRVDVLQDYEGRESCMEVTKLYRAANKLIKTLSLARTSMMQGNDNTALLSYNEVANLFYEKHKLLEQTLLNQSDSFESPSNSPMKKKSILNQTKADDFTAHSKLLSKTQEDEVVEVGAQEMIEASVHNKNVAICYNNIACIHAKKKSYAQMAIYFEESIRIEEHLVNISKIEKNFTTIEENVRLGFRYFNYGYSLYRQYISQRKKMQQNKIARMYYDVQFTIQDNKVMINFSMQPSNI
ncbi:hypothetical protein FGO68_gene13379 [Halteria grandinella]|uniref:Transmembrane protein n=1 Tax=Halteria grandinella TaxID=5974 RepID=A0A8J8T918_HALGN|nr:hypothetical protein FGO68_gene13379 [Halteria grandinella]